MNLNTLMVTLSFLSFNDLYMKWSRTSKKMRKSLQNFQHSGVLDQERKMSLRIFDSDFVEDNFDLDFYRFDNLEYGFELATKLEIKCDQLNDHTAFMVMDLALKRAIHHNLTVSLNFENMDLIELNKNFFRIAALKKSSFIIDEV